MAGASAPGAKRPCNARRISSIPPMLPPPLLPHPSTRPLAAVSRSSRSAGSSHPKFEPPRFMKHLLAFLALALPLHADPRNVDVSFFCLKYAPGTQELHVPQQVDPIRLSTANITAPVTVAVENDEAYFLTGAVTDPKKLPPLAAKVHIPKNINKALVVLVPAPSGSPQPYHGLVIDHGADFRMGTYRVINFSKRSIRGAIGKSYIEANSGGSA